MDGVGVGAGSYASTPPASISDSADVQATLNQHLYIDPSQAGKPVPTNQWWTDLLVSKFSGDLWAYPFVSSNSANGTKLSYPNSWNSDGTAMKLDEPITVGGTVTPAPDASDTILGDFEDGIPTGWTATGDAFQRVADGASRGQSAVSGWLGNRFLNSFTDEDGDGATGTLTSPDFTVDRSTIAFLIGGGNHPDQEAVQLVVDGQVVESATGDNSETLAWKSWDVSAYAGRTAQLRVVDALTAGWAHVLVDQVLLTNVPDGIAQRFSTTFAASEADALRWGDWNVSWRMPQAGSGGQYMDVTSMQGSPYEWFEFHGMTPSITLGDDAQLTDADGKKLSFPLTTDRFEVRQNGHVFGVHAPKETTFTRFGNTLHASDGTAYLVLSAVPKSGLTLDDLHKTAFAIPRDTTMAYTYDTAKGQVEQQWSVSTDTLQGDDHNTIQGWLQHQYAESSNNLRFTGATYDTPRGVMKTTVGHGGWTLDYAFSGITPIGGAPSVDAGSGPAENAYSTTVMKKYLSDYAAKTTYGGDTYWGGKDLLQLAEYMMVAKQIGDTDNQKKLQTTLTAALTDWYTYTDGESEHFFAMYPTWKALIGFADSYGSAQFNDNHFHYGYFAVATALLAQVDPSWAQQYAGMATLVVKQYGNWDRTDTQFPHLRTFGVWEGHSNAGGVSSPGGNNQESSSEAIQSEAGEFLLGTVLGNADMQAAGAMAYVTERAAVRDYYQNVHGNPASASYDGNGAFPPAYKHGQVGILFDSGQAEATYFSGDPAWIYGIQWMPTAPWFDYFGWDPDFSKSIMKQMMTARPKSLGDGIAGGNVAHVQMLTKKWWGVGSYGDTKITQDRQAAIGELQDAIRALERNHPGYVTQKIASNPLWDAASDTLYVSIGANGDVVFPAAYWTPDTLPASLVPAKLDGADADKQPADWPVQSPLLPFLVTDYEPDADTINRLYGVDLTDYEAGRDTAHAAAVFSEMGDALGQVVLGYLAQYDPDTYADIHHALWTAGDPAVTGQSMAGMVYYQAMSNRTVGTEVTNRHTSDPLSQVFRAADGTYSYVLDNPDTVQHSYDVYDGDTVIGQIAVPANTQITSHLDARLTKITVGTDGSPRTVVPGSTTVFTATGYDQYGATIPLDGVQWTADVGTVEASGGPGAGSTADATYTATTRTDKATVTASIGSVHASYEFRVAPAPVLTGLTVTPGFDQAVVGEPKQFAATGQDQYGDPAALPGAITWSYTGPGTIAADGTLTTNAPGAGYVVATAGGAEGTSIASSVGSIPDAALSAHASATSSLGDSTPDKAVDGDDHTRWESRHGSDDVDYTLDLGRATDISRVGIRWEAAAAKRYILQTADTEDGPWHDVQTVDKSDASADDVAVGQTARWVRVHGVSRLTQYGYSIWDIHVYGTPAASTIAPTQVLVGPRTASVLPKSKTQLAAYAFDPDGNGGRSDATWAVAGGDDAGSAGGVGSVDNSGTYTAPDSGGVSATVTAVVGTVSGQSVISTIGDRPDQPNQGHPQDIAIGKPTETSSNERGDLDGSRAVDGAGSTRWSSTAADGQWISVDLGQVVPIDSVELDWEDAYADAYRIQVRDTASDDWKTVVDDTRGQGGDESHALSGVSGRYVRMLADTRHTQYGVSLWEFRVMSSAGAPTPDLANNATVSSSSDESTSVPAGAAVDGDSTTRWASGHTDDQWLEVDLGSAKAVHRATLVWESAYGKSYRIEARNSVTDPWTTLSTTSNGSGGTENLTLDGTWRYIRFHGTERATPFGYSLYSFEIR
ncbi:discoidin domain-containing protein [Plantibacter sp. Mn2098]|uniref:discoidin domain-containing protein n=1 Tax=Plantibacter sp. Mn2098 TaxID=3395266 RepID=UPI003BBE8FAA